MMMSKNLANISDSLKLSHAVKVSVLFIFFFALAVDKIYASNCATNACNALTNHSLIKQRTIDVLKVENKQFNIDIGRLRYFYKADTQEENNILITLEKYTDMKTSIIEFDDSIKYSSVTIVGGMFTLDLPGMQAMKEEREMFERFIKAFGGLNAKKLILNNISFLKYDTAENSSLSETKLNVERLVLQDLSRESILDILKRHRFKDSLELIFENNKSYNWDFLVELAELQTYKKIQIWSIRNFAYLNIAQKEVLKDILPVLVIMEMPSSIKTHIPSELQEILKKSISNFKTIPIHQYEKLCKIIDINSNSFKDGKVEILARYIYDFQTTSSSTNTRYTEGSSPNQEQLSSKKESEHKLATKDTHPVDSSSCCPPSFEVIIRTEYTTLLTTVRLSRILLWAAENIKDATKITITNFYALDDAISLFESMYLDVRNLPYLKCVQLHGTNKTGQEKKIVITDIRNK